MAKSEDELKAEIKRKLGLESIDDFLDYHIQQNSDGENPSQVIIREIVDDLNHPLRKEIYHYFLGHGTEEELEQLSIDHRKEIMDVLSVVLSRARDISVHHGNKVVELLRTAPSQPEEEGLESFSEYWRVFFAIVNEAHLRRVGKLERFMEELASYSREDRDLIYEGYIFSHGKGQDLVPEALEDAVKLLTAQEPKRGALLLKGRYGSEWGEVAVKWEKTQPYVFEYDRHLERIINLYENGKYASVNLLEEIFDFSIFSHFSNMSEKEFQAYFTLVQKFGAGDFAILFNPLKKARMAAEYIRISPHSETFNSIYASGLPNNYFSNEGIDLMKLCDNLITQDNTLFSFYQKILKEFPSDLEEIAHPNFIGVHLATLYFLDKTGIMPLSKLKKLQKDLDIKEEDLGKKGTFYSYARDWCKIFSFGKTPSAELFERIPNHPSESNNFLKALLGLKDVRKDDYDSAISFLGELSKGIFSWNYNAKVEVNAEEESSKLSVIGVTEFAKALSKREGIDYFILNAREDVIEAIDALAKCHAGTNEKVPMIASFLSVTSNFYHQLQSSCSEEIILGEYKQWLKEGRKVDSLTKWTNHFSTESSSFREIFLRYNAPATYEEQVEVARTVAAAVSRKDLPCGRISVPDLALEIPFGGGKTILLPSEINLYQSKKENAKIYSLLASLYSGMHAYGGFELSVEALNEMGKKRRKAQPLGSLSDYFSAFSNYELAESIFIAVEQIRLFSHLVQDFPGLEKEVQSYFEVRQRAKSRAKFSHPSEEMVFDAYQRAMQGESSVINPNYAEVVAKIQSHLESVKGTATVADSVRVVDKIYTSIETACKLTKKPIPPKDNKALSPRVLEEILKERMRGEVNGTQEFAVLKERGFRYKEHTSEGEAMATVHEEKVPARKNPVYAEILKRGSESVALMREQLEQLLPEDPYIERRRMHGTLDRRAFLRYKQEKAQGKAPNPRIRYQKIVEKRDVAAVLALNLSRSANQPLAGTTPAAAMQRLMTYFSEASQQLGDKVGLYGFSGIGRDNVIVYTFKDIEEPFSEEVYYRMAFVMGHDHNRNGAVYRHLTHKLDQVKAEKKLFLEVCPTFIPSDLKYEGRSALDDSAHAINGMKLQEIAPLCICLSQDEASRRNLIKVFGDGHYLLTSPQKLFKDLATAYVQLTGE